MNKESVSLPPAIFLMGPTASGKTRVAVELVKQLPCEIISVDSAQVYRGLDIGSGKPDQATLELAPHRLVDIRDPSETYSAADFRENALSAMHEITANGKIPLLVGGTMLYFKVLRDGLATMPPADPEIRRGILAQAEREGWPALHAILAEVDPKAAVRIQPGDTQRLQRALEVYKISGRPISEFHGQEQDTKKLPFRIRQLALCPGDRAILHDHINTRFLQMLKDGFVEEVEGLRRRGDLDITLPAIRSVGYRQIWGYLEGQYGYDDMIARALAATRQLAKRQLTWLRNWPQMDLLDSEQQHIVQNCLKIVTAATN